MVPRLPQCLAQKQISVPLLEIHTQTQTQAGTGEGPAQLMSKQDAEREAGPLLLVSENSQEIHHFRWLPLRPFPSQWYPGIRQSKEQCIYFLLSAEKCYFLS